MMPLKNLSVINYCGQLLILQQTVTKVIITSQAGGGMGSLGGQQQVRLVSSQSGSSQVTSSPTKLTLQQAQQMGLISPSKPVTQSPNKVSLVQ